MKLFRPLFVIIILVFSLGCATSSRKHIRLPSRDISTYSNIKTQQGISVAIEVLDKQRTKEIFGVDLIAGSIQPIYVIVKNDSQDKHWFSKAGSDKRYIQAREVPSKIYEGFYGRFFPGGTLGMVRWPFLLPGAVIDKYKAGKVKSRLEAQEEFNEIPDTHIQTGEEIQGIMFVAVREDNRFTLSVTNSKNLRKNEFIFHKDEEEKQQQTNM